VTLLEQLESNIRNLDGLCARSLVEPMKPSDPDHALGGALASDDFFLKRPTGLGEAVDLIALDARERLRSICLCPYDDDTAAYRRDVEDLRNCLAEMMRAAGADRPVTHIAGRVGPDGSVERLNWDCQGVPEMNLRRQRRRCGVAACSAIAAGHADNRASWRKSITSQLQYESIV
jgi:hypothetical protein